DEEESTSGCKNGKNLLLNVYSFVHKNIPKALNLKNKDHKLTEAIEGIEHNSDFETESSHEEIMEGILKRCDKQILFCKKNNKPCKFSNYMDYILAVIYCQGFEKLRKEFTLEKAITKAKFWQQEYENEPDPYYYHGVLMLIEGLIENNKIKKGSKNKKD